jgi:hypothetical protein
VEWVLKYNKKNQQFGYAHTYLGGKYIGVGPEVELAGTILISCDSWIASFFFFFFLGEPLHAQ